MRYFLPTLILFLPSLLWGQITVSGYLTDQDGEALIAAHVFDTVSQQGALTNTYGFYTLSLPGAQRATLRFSTRATKTPSKLSDKLASTPGA